MKKIVLLRHGRYNADRLTAEGRIDVKKFTEALQPYIAGSSVVVLSSDIDRAIETGSIVSELLNCPHLPENRVLCYGDGLYDINDFSAAVHRATSALIDRQSADTVILASHQPNVECFPLWLTEQWGEAKKLKFRRANYAEGVLLDTVKQEGVWLPKQPAR